MIDQLMVDLETLSTDDNAVILSVGLVMFDILTGEIGSSLRVDIDPEDSERNGGHISASTVVWWLKQDKAAQQSLLHGGDKLPLSPALLKISAFIHSHDVQGVWANSPSFDLVKLGNAYKRMTLLIPWKFWMERDCRTLVALDPSVRESCVNDLPHDAVSDCIYQIRYVSATWRKLRGLSLL